MSNGRMLFIKIVLVAMIGLIVWRLFDMQIINGEGYNNLSSQRVSANIVDKAPRGEITDRNGKVLVTNRKGYLIKLQKTSDSDEELNAMLLKLFKILEDDGMVLEDTLPLSAHEPYQFTFANEDEKSIWFYERKSLNEDMTPDEVYEYFRDGYGVSEEYSADTQRKLIGQRYEMRKAGFSINTPYILAEDISPTVVTKIKERQDEFQGVSITQDYFRKYTSENLGAHILGRVGKIYQEEYAELKQKGYGMNDLVGKEGIEKICEEYLRGTDGNKNVYYGKSAELLGNSDVSSVPGDYVVLTIDSNLQEVAEKSLEENIKKIAAAGAGRERRGGDCDSGAAVVVDVRNGDILTLANYPNFNPETFNEDYNILLEDAAKPLWNRAISGTYTPGSTFKPLTAIAALSTGAITADTEIECAGVYTFFEDYQPNCWIWSEQRQTHEVQNVSMAIQNSCNIFFFETGRLTGIDAIAEYAKKFGLTQKTGIELSEEKNGNVSSPSYKKTLYENPDEQKWWAGDTIQTAIGQSYSAFTPIGLANYAAAIANGGTVYKTHIIGSVHKTTNDATTYERTPEVLNKVEIDPADLHSVKQGMRGVADEGSARQIFSEYPIEIGGKTGTAQISKKSSNNALFIAFAPFENPEIAVCVVLEHGLRGANAAFVARDIFDEYFGFNNETAGEFPDIGIISGELLP